MPHFVEKEFLQAHLDLYTRLQWEETTKKAFHALKLEVEWITLEETQKMFHKQSNM